MDGRDPTSESSSSTSHSVHWQEAASEAEEPGLKPELFQGNAGDLNGSLTTLPNAHPYPDPQVEVMLTQAKEYQASQHNRRQHETVSLPTTTEVTGLPAPRVQTLEPHTVTESGILLSQCVVTHMAGVDDLKAQIFKIFRQKLLTVCRRFSQSFLAAARPSGFG